MYDDVTYVHDDVTYVYDDVTYVYDDVTRALVEEHITCVCVRVGSLYVSLHVSFCLYTCTVSLWKRILLVSGVRVCV